MARSALCCVVLFGNRIHKTLGPATQHSLAEGHGLLGPWTFSSWEQPSPSHNQTMIFHCRLAFRQIAKLQTKTDCRERQPLAVVN
jgi:hypothetical protein